ncbi:RNA polymerase sigma factor [Microbacterium sp.]|uniref:RNA polymerase sigma factor n=1 Tax=Microbacterium sp. TaxID=51671 RepID=UPI003C7757A1
MGAEDLALELDDDFDDAPIEIPDSEWVARLSAAGAAHDQAVAVLLQLMLRAARHQITRMPMAGGLGVVRRDEIAQTAAHDATLAVLGRLERFEGRSRFTTWAYKFGILYAGVQLRRAVWHDRNIVLHDIPEIADSAAESPAGYSEARELAEAIRGAMTTVLTPHQRRIALALLVDEVPIDVLAERLGSTRGALYKTLHDARKRLRTQLIAEGLLLPPEIEEVGV